VLEQQSLLTECSVIVQPHRFLSPSRYDAQHYDHYANLTAVLMAFASHFIVHSHPTAIEPFDIYRLVTVIPT
jgi:hypothetical protein